MKVIMWKIHYVLWCLHLFSIWRLVQGHENYASVLTEQLNQYCDLHNRCPQTTEQSQHAPRIGKAGPRGPQGPTGSPGKVNYTVVKELLMGELAEIRLEERLNDILQRLSSLEQDVSKLFRKNCIGLDKTEAKIQNETGGVFEIMAIDVDVYCDLTTAGGGWMVFQRRMDGSENFERNWDDYVAGFGRPEREFWLGLDNLHKITNRESHELRVDLEDWDGNKYYASYTTFSIGDAASSYILTAGGYSGTAGDSLSYHSGYRFYTVDQDNGHSCARKSKGAWWYHHCFYSNLNGLYMKQWKYTGSHSYGVEWWHVKSIHWYSFKFAEMKIRLK